MAYIKTNWEDLPSEDTPITSANLQKIEDALAGMLDYFYPVGTIYETTSNNLDTTTKMANHFGGTWEVYGAGRVLVAKSADTEFDTIGETGGSKTHFHMTPLGSPGNSDTQGVSSDSLNVYGYVSGTKSWYRTYNGAYSESYGTWYQFKTSEVSGLPPYIVVYRYRRTA